MRNELPGLLHCEPGQPVSGQCQVAMHLHAVLTVVGDAPLCELLSALANNPRQLQVRGLAFHWLKRVVNSFLLYRVLFCPQCPKMMLL